ncbi:hypothetical protein CIL05_20160 [Virgibacillus profundi]|uniref:Uncharacterized protein n=1 Tax=Virgibacillus profundi TaxID=2024555 RepID=A0A2A2I932_9BACI|nr:DUF2161 family putative PD-(D/E)XK-type phosphodiesterase [Virgibacillus profundi]PAV27794.1 hypothetical protein CIL05_20160 [Virgibacillus profundi]PXY52016.1 hypothetical protein CIT14_20140 [Virgibacillus profundi]
MSEGKFYETDLYEPIQHYFRAQGYEVQAEVNDCDVVAFKDDTLIIVELKLNLNITLLMQAAKRQRYTPDVYIAIQRPKTSLRRRRWRDLVHLVRRLELGLILVSFEGKKPSIHMVHEPGPFDRKRSAQQSKKGRDKLIKEARDRRSNSNIGGSSHVPTITTYKEISIQIAIYLDLLGPMSANDLKKLNTGERTYGILYNNYNKWFKRIGRGIYDLTDSGKKEYQNYPEIIKLYGKSDL